MNTVPQTTADLRTMVALIALADLPMPHCIRAQGEAMGATGKISILSMDFDRIADGQAWSLHLGGSTDTYTHDNGTTYLREGVIKWNGWSVQIHASEQVRVHELDDSTREQLQQLVDGGAA